MKAIRATAGKSYRRQQGNSGVRVGILDTGIDASHPDIAPNFNRALSRNFTTDDPLIELDVPISGIQLVWGFSCQGVQRITHFLFFSFVVPFFGSTRAASILPSRPQIRVAAARSDSQGWPLLQRPAKAWP